MIPIIADYFNPIRFDRKSYYIDFIYNKKDYSVLVDESRVNPETLKGSNPNGIVEVSLEIPVGQMWFYLKGIVQLKTNVELDICKHILTIVCIREICSENIYD